jgi:hypothetical protein
MKRLGYKLITSKPRMIFLSLIIISIFSESKIGILLLIIWLCFFTFWTLIVGEKLYEKLNNKSNLNLKRFKIQIFVVIIYFVVFAITGGYEINLENISNYGWRDWVIIPFHFILMYMIFHTIYFLSKCITLLRQKNENYGFYILGFLMFPIGIWIIQPKIIELLNDKSID